jgi:hypothetical protein
VNNRLEWRIAVRDSSLDATAKHVALTIDTWMNRRGIAWPSRGSLAAGTGRSTKTVDRALARLELAGFLVVARSTGRRSNLYCAAIPNSAPGDAVELSPTASKMEPTASKMTPNSGPGVPLSRKEAVRSRTPGRSRDKENVNTDTDPAMVELAHRWLRNP